MQTVLLQPTNYTPYVLFDPAGNLCLKGRSLMLDPASFYQPLIEWITQLSAPAVTFTIEMDYFNTSSSKKLLELLQTLNDHEPARDVLVIWGFEPNDEEMLEKGYIFKERLTKTRFQFTELVGDFDTI